MARFTLIEVPAPGNPPADQKKVPSTTPFTEGDEMLIVNRVLTDRHGNQRGTFVLRGTLVQVFSRSDALMHSRPPTQLRARA
jgi:hypothetical protein